MSAVAIVKLFGFVMALQQHNFPPQRIKLLCRNSIRTMAPQSNIWLAAADIFGILRSAT